MAKVIEYLLVIYQSFIVTYNICTHNLLELGMLSVISCSAATDLCLPSPSMVEHQTHELKLIVAMAQLTYKPHSKFHLSEIEIHKMCNRILPHIPHVHFH